jgi:hypothetical protein
VSAQVDAIIRALERGIARAVSETTLEVHARLVEATPVDTGWARANWVPSVGKPHGKTEGRAPTSRTKPGTKSGVGDGAITTGTANVIAMTRPERCYVTNNVPYVAGAPPSLDSGHSTQAPRGFIRKAVADGVAFVSARYKSAEVKL